MQPAFSLCERKSISVGGRTLFCKVLTSQEDKSKGYQFQKQKPKPNEGLLFVFEQPSRHSFHMKNVWFDLELLSFDEVGVYLEKTLMKSTCGPSGNKNLNYKKYNTHPACKFVIECQPEWGSFLKRGVSRINFKRLL